MSRCPGELLYLKFLCTHVQQFWSSSQAAPLPLGVGALLRSSRAAAAAAAVPLRRAGRRVGRHRVPAPSSDDTNGHREADDCDRYYEEEVVKHLQEQF